MEGVVRERSSVKAGQEEDTGQYSAESKDKENLLRALALYSD